MARIIVHTVHRYKRPPKRKKAVPLKVGRIARAGEPAEPSHDNVGKTRIVTAKAKPGRFVPDMTSEEHRRRGDAADALFRELVRRATGTS
jgi:hypothetical protein